MSLLDQLRSLPQQVLDRLKELEPLAREYEQLRKFAERLGVPYAPDPDAEAEPEQPRTTAHGATRAQAAFRARGGAASAHQQRAGSHARGQVAGDAAQQG
ncbi:MAG TPA: hypothetical protein VLE94_00880, partial [Burkholderiaceae bacterium]|nr:hypothetical protein [Burkholderiaceae bacterium]